MPWPWPTPWAARPARVRRSANRRTGSNGPRPSSPRCSSRRPDGTSTSRRCAAGSWPATCASPWPLIADSGHEMAGAVLAGVAATDERERSGIFSTASGLLAAYRSEAVLDTAKEPNFDPVAFARSSDSLYICAPAQDQDRLAPLVVALLEQIRAAVLTRPPDAAPVVFALDEVANIAPLPSLPALAAEGGGQGLVTLACLQDLSQARVRWGEAAEGFFTLFGTKVILPGVADHRTLAPHQRAGRGAPSRGAVGHPPGRITGSALGWPCRLVDHHHAAVATPHAGRRHRAGPARPCPVHEQLVDVRSAPLAVVGARLLRHHGRHAGWRHLGGALPALLGRAPSG